MAEVDSLPDLSPWAPTPTRLSEDWKALADMLAQQAKGLPHAYVMPDVRYNARDVGNKLRSCGLPWPVVMAAYLYGYDEEQIRYANLNDVDQVLNHITETNLYARYIEEENLPPLLTPPYRDLGALLIAVVAYYQALQTLQEQSKNQPYTGTKQAHIESIGRTLLNIAKRLGMWQFKREIEDLAEQLRSPRKFAEAKQEHTRILQQDAALLEETQQLLESFYRQATEHPINVIYTPCGVAGMKRRLQDAHTTAPPLKAQLTGFDLVTFEITVPTVQECYMVLGVLSQLGYIQDRVTDQIANPKPNGCSHLAFGLILKSQNVFTQSLKWPEIYTPVCQLQIATRLMHAITWYGCLYPDYYQWYTQVSKEGRESPSVKQLWSKEEGRVFLALKEPLATSQSRPETNTPIVVYDKNRRPIKLPKGATALDFAYALDSVIGEHAVEAFINNRKAPLYRMLDASDIVEIRTSSENQAQDYWLHKSYTTTSIARSQVKKSLHRRFPARRGHDLIRQELERYHYMLPQEELDHELHTLVKHYNLGTLQAYLERLDKKGEPPYTPNWAAQKIIMDITEHNEPLSTDRGRSSWIPALDMHLTANKSLFRQQHLCSFCQPTYPHDMKIMGRLHKQSGKLVVHKESCPHLIDRSNSSHSILLPMIWQPQPLMFKVSFFIIAQDRKGLILDLARQLRRHQCELLSIHAETISKWGEGRIRFSIETHSDKEVLDIWQELYKIESVIKAEINAAATPTHIYERLQKAYRQKPFPSGQVALESIWTESLALNQVRSPILVNPFDISRPATAGMFFGRSTEIERMQRELCDSRQGRALILYGPRRSGKSSICKNFLERQVQQPFWGVLFSLQNAIQHTEETILMQLAEKICREFSQQLQRPACDWQSCNANDPQVRFRHIVQRCIDQVPDARLVLALDEFGGALESYKNQMLEYRFFTFWKELMSEISQLSLILALPTDAHMLLNSSTLSQVFNFAEHLPVSFLDTKSARQLLVDPLKDQNIAIHPNTVALAVKLTGGSPYYMTLIGKRLIQQLNREKEKQLITDEDLTLVIDQFIFEGTSQNFVFLRQELQNNDEFHVLETIVELTDRAKQSKVQLKRIADKLDLPISVTRQHLDRLRIGLILEENGPSANPYYSFRIELIRRWLEQNRWFFSETIHK